MAKERTTSWALSFDSLLADKAGLFAFKVSFVFIWTFELSVTIDFILSEFLRKGIQR